MASTPTTNYGFEKPTVGASTGEWGTELNTGLDAADAAIKAAIDLLAPLASPTFTGTVTAAAINASGAVDIGGRLTVDDVVAAVSNLGSGSGSFTPNLSNGNYFYRTISGNSTVNVPSNLPSSGTLASWVLEVTTTASQTLSWHSAYDWPGGSTPSQTAAGTDIYVCWTRDGGTTIYALKVAEDVS